MADQISAYVIYEWSRRLWLNSLLLRMMLTKSRSKNKTTYATTRLVLQKGLEIKAQLQKHALRVKLSSVDMRKGQEISEGNYGFSIKKYGILLPKLF